ncbi:MAG: ATP-binding protein [Verrucomicrobiota bacterium]|nr:ATP-binding protein [Limisphaera sp.]MDW8382989.1 ATP-binding protein [Verrucomicrobiota bacterium]
MVRKQVSSTATELQQAFDREEKANRVSTGKVAALLVAVLMPFGATLDIAVYPASVWEFGLIRVGAAVLALVIWWLLTRPWGQEHHRFLGIVTAWLPAVCICWMIYRTEGPLSPYYAGLNLILLAISLVVRWNAWESILAVGGVLAMYLSTAYLADPAAMRHGRFVANCIFLIETGVIVVVGNHFFSKLRVREFRNRYELDHRKKELEEALTRLREAEAQLIQQEKMASLGVLSAGIIHEINNPLNFAATNLYALRKRVATMPPEQRKAVEEIVADVEDGLSRVRDIVADLRTFTHPEVESLEAVDVAEAVQAALRYLSGETPDGVRIDVHIAPGLAVRASRNKMVHVLINLVENSLDALRRKTFGGETPSIRITGCQEDDRIRLEVWDNGPGIAPEHLGRVFDPFFTTKDVGEGMGLGLSICYRLLQECGARIRVESDPGQFCRFILEFPRPEPHVEEPTGSHA